MTDRETITRLREDLELERLRCAEKEKTITKLESDNQSTTTELRKLRNDCHSLQTQLNKERDAYAALDRQRITLLKDIEADSAKVSALRSEVHENELRELRAAFRREQNESASLKESLETANQLVAQLREELDQAQEERARAERRANADRRASSLTVLEIERDREASQRRIGELHAEVERLRSELYTAEASRGEVRSVKASFVERERSLTAALNDLEVRCVSLTDRCTALERERGELQQRSRDSQSEADDRVAEIATRCATLIDSLESTRAQLNEANKRVADLESAAKRAQQNIEQGDAENLKKRVAELDETVAFLKEERDDLRRRNARYFDEKMEKHEKARTLERENRELKQALETARLGRRDAVESESRSAELESARTRLRELEAKLADNEKLLETTLTECERRCADLEKRNEQRVAEAEKRAEAKNDTASLRERVRELELREATSLSQKLVTSESRATLAAAENRAKSLKEKLDLVQAQLDSAKYREKKLVDELEAERGSVKRLEDLERTHATCAAEISRLNDKVKQLETSSRRLETELSKERDAVRKATGEKDRAIEELRTVRSRHSEADTQYNQLLKEFNVVKDSFAEADRQLSVFEKTQEHLEAQRAELKESARVLRARLDDAEKQLAERATQIREAQQNFSQAQDTVKLLTQTNSNEMDLLRKAGEQYRSKIAQLETETLKMTKLQSQSETKIRNLEDELRATSDKLRRTQTELGNNQKECSDLEKRLTDTARKCNELSGSLDEAIVKYETLMEEKVELEEHLANIQHLFDTEEFTHSTQMQQTAKLIEFVQENTRKLEKLRKKTAKANKKEPVTPASTINRASWNVDTIKRNSALLSTPLATNTRDSAKIASARLALTAATRARAERVPDTPTTLPRSTTSRPARERDRTPDTFGADHNESSYASHSDDPLDADSQKHVQALTTPNIKSPSKRQRHVSTHEPPCTDANSNTLPEQTHAMLDSSAYIPLQLQNGSTRTIAASSASSSSSSSQSPGPHQLVRGVNTKSCTCAVCLGVIHFTKDAFKCEKCHHMCHPECQDIMANWYTCGSLLEVQQAYRCVVALDTELTASDAHSSQPIELMRGFVKLPTRSASFGEFWESRFLVLDRTRLSVYDADPRTLLGGTAKPSRVQTIQLGNSSGRLFVQPAVNSRMFPTVVHSDLVCMFKLCLLNATSESLPNDQLVVLCSSITEKHRWCAALSFALAQAQAKASLTKGLPTVESLLHVDSILKVNTRMKVPSGSRPSKKTQRLDLLATHSLSATDFLLIGTERGLYAHKTTTSVLPSSAFSTPTLVRVIDFREPVFIMRELQTERAELFVWVAGANRALYAVQLQRMRNRVFESRDVAPSSKTDVTKSPGGTLNSAAKKLRSEPWEFPVVHVQSLVGCLAFETFRNSAGYAYAACATIDRILVLQFTYQQEVPDGCLLRTADGFTLIDEILIERPCTSLLLENERIIYSYDSFYSKRLNLLHGSTSQQQSSQAGQINRFVLADALNVLPPNSRGKTLLSRLATVSSEQSRSTVLQSGTGVLQFSDGAGSSPIAAFAYASRDKQTYHVLVYSEFGLVVNEAGECASRDVELWPGSPNAVSFRQPLLMLFYPVGALAYRVRRDATSFRFELEPLGTLPYVAPRCLQLGSTPTTNSANPLLVSAALDHDCVEVLQISVNQ